jgi:hypothetical protein
MHCRLIAYTLLPKPLLMFVQSILCKTTREMKPRTLYLCTQLLKKRGIQCAWACWKMVIMMGTLDALSSLGGSVSLGHLSCCCWRYWLLIIAHDKRPVGCEREADSCKWHGIGVLTGLTDNQENVTCLHRLGWRGFIQPITWFSPYDAQMTLTAWMVQVGHGLGPPSLQRSEGMIGWSFGYIQHVDSSPSKHQGMQKSPRDLSGV